MMSTEALRVNIKNQGRIHLNTVESRANATNENALANELNAFTNMLKRNFFSQNVLDLWTIRNTSVSADASLEKEFTYNVLYPHVQRGYELGAQYICRLLDKTVILLPEDAVKIQQLAKGYDEVYWGHVQEVLNRKYLDFNFEDKEPSKISNNFVVTSLSTAIAWGSMWWGTKTKGQAMINMQDVNLNTSGQTVQLFHAAIKNIEKQLGARNPGLFLKVGQKSMEVINLMWHWVTAEDNKVCQICRDLSEQEWSFDEAILPRNPDDSHLNCRCRLMLSEEPVS